MTEFESKLAEVILPTTEQIKGFAQMQDETQDEADAKHGERVATTDGIEFSDTGAAFKGPPGLTPAQHLSIQIWQTIAFAASNCVLHSQAFADKDLERAAYDILDNANECLKRAMDNVDKARGVADPATLK